MHIVLIAATARDNAIGAQGDLPWHLPADLDFFYRQIESCLLLSGRRSYDSAQGRAMFTPERRVIVVTRDAAFRPRPGAIVAASVEEAIHLAAVSGAPRLCVLGGAEIYRQTIGIAHELILTRVHAVFPQADSFFPAVDPAVWQEVRREEHTRDAENGWDFAFVWYRLRK
jgi:dihydrofolate reductase